MAMKLSEIVPFGRSLDEYKSIFSLSSDDLKKNILGVGDGPASVNAEMSSVGNHVISIDPIYQFKAKEIEERFYGIVDDIIDQVEASTGDWIWSYHRSAQGLKEERISVLEDFIVDYDVGKECGRYRVGELPKLAFEDKDFDLALCSHFLFLYSEHLTYEFHLSSILEMLRVAHEVRIFPLLTLMGVQSPYVRPLMQSLKAEGYLVSIEKVVYELQRGGNEMLRIGKDA